MADVDSEVPADPDGVSSENERECGDGCTCGVPSLDVFTEYAAEHGIESQALVDILQIAASWLEEHHFTALVDPSSDELLAHYALHGWQEGYCQAVLELRDATQELVAIDVPDDASELFGD